MDTPPSAPQRHPTFAEALRFWLRLGFISFGGPTGQIAIMHTELVEQRRWISEARFLHALNYCMLLPGPEAQQLATYCGWLLHRTWGGIAAGTLFVLPSVFILGALSFVYVTWGGTAWVGAIFHGLKPAVLAIVAAAVIRLGRKALGNGVKWAIAAAAFTAIFALELPFPLIIGAAAIAGWLGGRWWPEKFRSGGGHAPGGPGGSGAVLDDTHAAPRHARPSWARAARVLGVCLGLWWAPVLAAGAWLGWDSTLFRQGLFFSKAAMVTFGGAYAVLPYVAQQAVEHHGWLSAAQMLDGLAFAETTPGPLIMVLQHVGFMGGWNHPGTLPPLAAAALGAALTTWVTFLPCFLWIFLGAPHVEQLRGHARLDAALSAVTAAVVGVVLNLAVWFGWHVIRPEPGRVDGFVLVLAVAGFAVMQRWKVGLIPIVAAGAILGLGWQLIR
jgi:chromate transporter